ncbi:Gfo/Idh/MocA family oxidoreductase [Microbacterium sp. zg.Y625]|uniref:Gfo/Idh/MocA family protein n=1 Tax=Microbacterium jiangjiandongii TaxID=3049071 RepID=UPI00214BAF55|nr:MULTISPECIES: Gfo/Idh/MocA family oxidoreductase [unclassified Microbacterium]MCR2794096.1 Gfo/Idh/MocA family oxidoreductase [Microbacterium sp. zg.Y625]WIM25699.1 Gfo/Idh/MocA family oxidoreductase [Microbacterium sp. zg-Y625]
MISAGSKIVRIAVVGAGFMGRQHIGFIRGSSRAELVAVVDPRADALTGLDCPVFSETRSMLDTVHPDAVVVANPNAAHVDTARECIEAGAAVLLEKPMASSYSAALRLADTVARQRARLLVGHQRRHHPAIARARAAIHAGEIGQVVAVSGMWSARKDDAYFTDTPWHSEPGAGVTLINLVHDLDLLRHLFGEPAEVQAMSSRHARGLDVEDTVSVNLRFESGVMGSFLASDAGVSPWGWDQATEDAAAFPFIPDMDAYRVVGTRGALSLPNLARFSYDAGVSPDWHSPLSRTHLSASPRNSFEAQLDHFIDVAVGAAEPLISAADALGTLALVEAIASSARTGEPVDLARFRAALASRAGAET